MRHDRTGPRRVARRRGRSPLLPALVTTIALVGLVACGTPDAEVRAAAPLTVDLAAGTALPDRVPAGVVRVATPDGPASFLDLHGDDPAAADLAALWGLPLFRYDPSGQLTSGLVADWEVRAEGPGWQLELVLRPGRWSDGSEVTAEDVVATFEALRGGPRDTELAPLVEITAVEPARVHLRFEAPYARWWALLDGIGVLPAAVLAEGGLAAFEGGVPVSGGWFTVEEHVPGFRTTFVAHPEGPLGAPGLERVEVSVVPRYEAALGMLDRGDADVVLGYLALNGVERARRVEGGVESDAPLGGTTVGLWWRPDGPVGGPDGTDRRRAVAAAVDVSQLVEGLLGPAGERASSFVPGVASSITPAAAGPDVTVGEPTVILPKWSEAIAFTARALQRDLRTAGGGMQLVAEPAPDVVRSARTRGDASLAARRTGPAPSAVGIVADTELALAADAGGPTSVAFADLLRRSREDVLALPLYRVGVVHAWSPTVQGLRPSSWPGLAFWDVGAWTVDGSDGP